eukprot:356999-Chlamydomonas_euryale.AAC.4
MATTRWLVSCQAACQQLCLPTLAFKATDVFQQTLVVCSAKTNGVALAIGSAMASLEDAIALPDLLPAAAVAAAPDGHLRRGIGNAFDALAHQYVNCLDAVRPARF